MELNVVAAIIEKDGRYLIAQRKAEDEFGLLWEFPGGTVKEEEEEPEGLRREIREELGMEIEVIKNFKTVSYAYPDKKVRLATYICRIISGEPKAIGCAGFKWVKPGEFYKYEFPEADKPVLEDLLKKSEK